MKLVKVLSIAIVFTSGCNVFENEQNQEVLPPCDVDFLTVAEQMPILTGGLADLQSSIRYPEEAQRLRIEGRVTVQFLVSTQGTVFCPTVLRGIGGGCDEAAVEGVLKAKFEPGMHDGKPVIVQYSLPIVFRLQD